jgi:hypothetical protein
MKVGDDPGDAALIPIAVGEIEIIRAAVRVELAVL